MKPALLKLLVCPSCRDTLEMRVDAHDSQEVLEGALSCGPCGKHYPVVRGIPRFVGSGAYAASFGRQWNWFRAVQLDSANGRNESERTLAATTGWADADIAGRLVLDVGVGAGRFAEIIANKGGEVVGVDLSRAIDAAYENIGRRPNVHLVQADVFSMPFRQHTFDLAYAIGVLHHTPDPAAAFGRMAETLKIGGALAVYLYARYGWGHHGSDLIRVVSTRLPHPVMRTLAAAAIPMYYAYRTPLIGKVLALVGPISMHPDWRWRWLDTFDWYTPRYQWKFLYPEVFRWFRANGFRDVEIFDEPIRMRGTKSSHIGPTGS
jgi:ubiquinone/menaquinone biosynthesis C-methylase UbiE/uncharacterized protein YbaR (Trm112 family)